MDTGAVPTISYLHFIGRKSTHILAFKFALGHPRSGPKYPDGSFSNSHASFFPFRSVCLWYVICLELLIFILSVRKQEKTILLNSRISRHFFLMVHSCINELKKGVFHIT